MLRKEHHCVQMLTMADINQIEVETKLDQLRKENESLKSELSTIGLKQAADSEAHELELSYLQKEKAMLLGETEKLGTHVETLTLGLNSAKEGETSIKRQLYQV